VARVAVLLEEGRRRTFACALDWPGWARSARTPDDALVALELYRSRYADVLAHADLDAPNGVLDVVETVAGDAGTDFGAPTMVAERDRRALRAADRARLIAMLEACWSRFDAVALASPGLRPGPRGGGRSLDKVRRHVTDAEVSYARALGLRVSATDGDRAAIDALRARVRGVVDGGVVPERAGRRPVRYVVRRVAWHACDHLFEIEDRTTR
jgi:hypothetical protein